MKRFEILEVLYGGKWFYNKKSKTYQQKTIKMAKANSFKEAFEKWRDLRRAHRFGNYKIVCIEK